MRQLDEQLSELEKLQQAAQLIEEMSQGRLQVCPSVVGQVYIRPQHDSNLGMDMRIDSIQVYAANGTGGSGNIDGGGGSMAYFDYRKHGQFEWTAPAILFACLIFTLTAPTYVWTILGM